MDQVLYLFELFHYIPKTQLLISSFRYKCEVNENVNVTCFTK